MSKSLMIVSASGNYIPYLNALLNSITKYKLQERKQFDVLVLTDDSMPENYKNLAVDNFPFKIQFKDIDAAAAGIDPSWGKAWQCKAGRYYHLMTDGREYDSCCLMDADLYIVSDELVDYFGLVEGTSTLMGCNERIKWNISDIYQFDGKPMLEQECRLNKFHCNVPLFLDANKWQDVLQEYLKIIYRGIEHREGKEKVIGDLYSWNMAIYRKHREKDVMMIPMPSMTQVHRTGYRDRHCATKRERNGYWTTGDGDVVYCLHGRPDKPSFRSLQNKNEYQKHGIDKSMYKKYLKLIEEEWKDVNFNYSVDLREVVSNNPHWEVMGDINF